MSFYFLRNAENSLLIEKHAYVQQQQQKRNTHPNLQTGLVLLRVEKASNARLFFSATGRSAAYSLRGE
jgi:hypothetical protein